MNVSTQSSRAKLQCGHEFHLDCIGSTFNMNGAMQCSNCRKTEKGQWLYANGSARPLHELSSDDWIPYEDFNELTRCYIYMVVLDGIRFFFVPSYRM